MVFELVIAVVRPGYFLVTVLYRQYEGLQLFVVHLYRTSFVRDVNGREYGRLVPFII